MLYHVKIDHKSPKGHGIHVTNLSREILEDRVLSPYRQNSPITFEGTTIQPRDIGRIRIMETESSVQQRLDGRDTLSLDDLTYSRGERDVTNDFITGPAGSERESTSQPREELMPTPSTRKVFVVHGRNQAAHKALFEFLQAIDLRPVEWSEATQSTGKSSPSIGEILDAAFSQAHAVVVLFTPDDEARLREPFRKGGDPPYEAELTGQARPNVLFEAGMAMALRQDRTILVELGTLRPFTDIAGIHTIRLNNTSEFRQELAQRLKTAGCPVKLDGTNWYTAGDFEAVVEQIDQTHSNTSVAVRKQSTSADPLQLSEDAQELLVEASKDESGRIYVYETIAGVSIETNSKKFGEMGNSRSEAKWERALQDLLDRELIKGIGEKDEAFNVTHRGFEIADGLGT